MTCSGTPAATALANRAMGGGYGCGGDSSISYGAPELLTQYTSLTYTFERIY